MAVICCSRSSFALEAKYFKVKINSSDNIVSFCVFVDDKETLNKIILKNKIYCEYMKLENDGKAADGSRWRDDNVPGKIVYSNDLMLVTKDSSKKNVGLWYDKLLKDLDSSVNSIRGNIIVILPNLLDNLHNLTELDFFLKKYSLDTKEDRVSLAKDVHEKIEKYIEYTEIINNLLENLGTDENKKNIIKLLNINKIDKLLVDIADDKGHFIYKILMSPKLIDILDSEIFKESIIKNDTNKKNLITQIEALLDILNTDDNQEFIKKYEKQLGSCIDINCIEKYKDDLVLATFNTFIRKNGGANRGSSVHKDAGADSAAQKSAGADSDSDSDSVDQKSGGLVSREGWLDVYFPDLKLFALGFISFLVASIFVIILLKFLIKSKVKDKVKEKEKENNNEIKELKEYLGNAIEKLNENIGVIGMDTHTKITELDEYLKGDECNAASPIPESDDKQATNIDIGTIESIKENTDYVKSNVGVILDVVINHKTINEQLTTLIESHEHYKSVLDSIIPGNEAVQYSSNELINFINSELIKERQDKTSEIEDLNSKFECKVEENKEINKKLNEAMARVKKLNLLTDKTEECLKKLFDEINLVKPDEIDSIQYMKQLVNNGKEWVGFNSTINGLIKKYNEQLQQLESEEKDGSNIISFLNLKDISRQLKNFLETESEVFSGEKESDGNCRLDMQAVGARLRTNESSQIVKNIFRANDLFEVYFNKIDNDIYKRLYLYINSISSILEAFLSQLGVKVYRPPFMQVVPEKDELKEVALELSSMEDTKLCLLKKLIKNDGDSDDISQAIKVNKQIILDIEKYGFIEKDKEKPKVKVVVVDAQHWFS